MKTQLSFLPEIIYI